MPANFSWPGLLNPVAEAEPNDTLDVAQNLGDLSSASRAEVVGNIGNGTPGLADVDWFHFTLDAPADIHLATLDQGTSSTLSSVLSLYNSDPQDFNDLYDPVGNRQLAQDDGAVHGGDAQIDRLLGAGSYYVAVSGSGNRYFHPYLAGSGNAGSTGDYGLQITATDVGIAPTDGPVVLAGDPAPNTSLAGSPFLIRVDVSGQLNSATFVYAAPGQPASTYTNPAPGQTIELRYSATGDFTPGNYIDIGITPNFQNTGDPTNPVNEFQIAPAAPLAPGFYQLFLAGNTANGPGAFLTDINNLPLGQNANNLSGANYVSNFQITGINGVVGATTTDDTVATAQDLGDITAARLVQIPGAIGIDPTDPTPFNPAEVNIHKFDVSGAGRFAFTAEAFAGRIGSPLDPALTLFQMVNNQPVNIWTNDNTTNPSVATNGATPPLFNDPALFVGLTEGEYYLAVSTTGDVPDPTQNQPFGPGVFQPTVSHSATLGTTTGDYVLSLGIKPQNTSPQVLSVTPSEGTTLNAPPTQITVQFSEPVNLQQLAFVQGQQNGSFTLPAVYVEGSDNNQYFSRMESYDPETGVATFLMLDGLPNGVNRLHLVSGPQGITDLAGNPLVDNDPSGDYVVSFTVNGPNVGTPRDPLNFNVPNPSGNVNNPMPLGTLFPNDFHSGVTINRTGTSANMTDSYQFEVLQSRPYFFTFTSGNLPRGTYVAKLTDANGHNVFFPSLHSGVFSTTLNPGTYELSVSGWTTTQAGAGVNYLLTLTIATTAENPPPLTVRPAPAYQILLIQGTSPAPPPAPVPAPNTSGSSGSSLSSGSSNTPAPTPAPTPTPSSGSTNPLPAAPSSSPPASNPPPATPPADGSSNPVIVSSPSTPVVQPMPPVIQPTPPSSNPVDAPPRLTLPTLPATAPVPPVIQVVIHDPSADFRSLAVSSTDTGAARTDAPSITNANSYFVREANGDFRIYLTVPASAALGLSAPPVGGVRGGGTDGDNPSAPRFVLPANVQLLERAALRVLNSPNVRAWRQLWQRTLDTFFAEIEAAAGLLDWLRQLPSTPADGMNEAPQRPNTPTDKPEQEARLEREAADPLARTSHFTAGAMFLLGLMAPANDTEARRRARQHRKLPHTNP